jgi:hypothetical protein
LILRILQQKIPKGHRNSIPANQEKERYSSLIKDTENKKTGQMTSFHWRMIALR